MYKISVIIPVFGVERYIERCARSLFEQTLEEIEYVFVDDCTLDKSIDILRDVMNQYPNRKDHVIIIKHNENLGLPSARHTGIQNAHGKYIAHCDSDDWVEKNMYELLYDKAEKSDADIVFCNYIEDSETSKKIVQRNIHDFEDKFSLISKLLQSQYHLNPVWGILSKKSLYCNDIIYPVKNQTEDLALMVQLIYYSKNCVIINNPLYHYFINSNSIMHNPGRTNCLNRARDSMDNKKIVFDFLNKKGIEDKFANEIECSKMLTRYFVKPIKKDNGYKKIWNSVYPELNCKLYINSLIPLRTKIYNILVQAGFGAL